MPVIGGNACHVQEAVGKAKATAFDAQTFRRPLSQKTHACLVRRYGANHLAQHSKKGQRMKLLGAAEDAPEDKAVNWIRLSIYSFRLGSNMAIALAISIPAASADLRECADLVTDCEELAALRHKSHATSEPYDMGWEDGMYKRDILWAAFSAFGAALAASRASAAPRRHLRRS